MVAWASSTEECPLFPTWTGQEEKSVKLQETVFPLPGGCPDPVLLLLQSVG